MNEGANEKPLSRTERTFARMAVAQTITAVVAVMVSVIALYAALNEADAVRKQQQASVWPHLTIYRSYYGAPGETRVIVSVDNRGIGPARVRSVSAHLDGEPVDDWFEVVNALTPERDQPFRLSNSSTRASVIEPGANIQAVILAEPQAPAAYVAALRDALDEGRLRVEICYCSVFDECWRTLNVEPEPAPVGSCPEQDPRYAF